VTNPPIWARGPRDDVLVTNREGFILDDAYALIIHGGVDFRDHLV
jgi:hypothetical protein